jgi:hypothetical protein
VVLAPTGADSWIWRPERYMSSRPWASTCSSTLAGTCNVKQDTLLICLERLQRSVALLFGKQPP